MGCIRDEPLVGRRDVTLGEASRGEVVEDEGDQEARLLDEEGRAEDEVQVMVLCPRERRRSGGSGGRGLEGDGLRVEVEELVVVVVVRVERRYAGGDRSGGGNGGSGEGLGRRGSGDCEVWSGWDSRRWGLWPYRRTL